MMVWAVSINTSRSAAVFRIERFSFRRIRSFTTLMAAGVLDERGRPDLARSLTERLPVLTDGGIDEIPLHPVKFEPSEYVAGSLTSQTILLQRHGTLSSRAVNKQQMTASRHRVRLLAFI